MLRTWIIIAAALFFSSLCPRVIAQEARGPSLGRSSPPVLQRHEDVPIYQHSGSARVGGHAQALPPASVQSNYFSTSKTVQSVLDTSSARNTFSPLDDENLPSFAGMSRGSDPYQDPIPPDPVVAAGPQHLVSLVNRRIAFYTKTGNQLAEYYLSSWFNTGGPPNNPLPFDPRVIYDHYSGRFVVLAALGASTSQAYYLVAVSQTSDPTGAWWKYTLDASVNGVNHVNMWADYPDIGFDADAVYICSFNATPSDSGLYTKVRILKKSELYNGLPVTFADFWNLRNADESAAFTVKPAHHFDSPSSAYLINTAGRLGGDYVTLWRIDNPASANPNLVRQATIQVGQFSAPHDVHQLGTTHTLDAGDSRAMNAVFRNNRIYTTFMENYLSASAIRYLKIHIGSNYLERDIRYGSAATDYFMPAVYVDQNQNVVLAFNRSSAIQYIDLRCAYHYFGQQSPGTSTVLSMSSGFFWSTNQGLRWGDYTGLALDPVDNAAWVCGELVGVPVTSPTGDEEENELWSTWIEQVSADVRVRFKNVVTDQTAEGSLKLDNVEVIPSGDYKFLPPNSNHNIRSLNERYTNWQGGGGTQKHHDWNAVDLEFKVSHDFTAPIATTAHENARFRELSPITVSNDLIDGGNGSIEIKDPWWVSDAETGEQPGTFHTVSSPMDSGAFRNQDPVLNMPSYFLKAKEVPLPGFTWYFLGWDATGADGLLTTQYETPVVFRQSGAVVKAKYKAHLGSSLTSATGSNSQRVFGGLVQGGEYPDLYHLLYASGNQIWLTTSQDQGTSWTPETRITDGVGIFSAPSLATWITPQSQQGIDADDPSLDLFTVYRKESGSYHDVYFHIGRGNPLVWQTPIRLNALSTISKASIDSRPVVGRRLDDVLALWEDNNGLHGSVGTETSPGIWSWQSEALGAGLHNPSISSTSFEEGNPALYVTCDDGDDIFLYDETLTPISPAPASLPEPSFSSQVCADTRVVDEHEVFVVWEALNMLQPPPSETDGGRTWGGDAEPQHKVMYQRYSKGSWVSAHEFRSATPTINYYRPSIGNLSNGHLLWTWDNGTNGYFAQYNGANWVIDERVYPRLYANAPISGTSGPLASMPYAYTTPGTTAPYHLGTSTEVFTSPAEGGAPLVEIYSRRVEAAVPDKINGNSSFALELGDVKIKLSDGQHVSMTFVDDTLRGLDEVQAWRQLATRRITLPAGIDSIIINGNGTASRLVSLLGTGETALRLGFDLVDAQTGEVIRRLGTERRLLQDTTDALRIRERLTDLAGREVIVRPSLAGFARKRRGMVFTLVHVHTVVEDTTATPTSPLAKAQGEVDSQAQLPTVFALHQNYPNPFNPSTRVDYDLPHPANVSLVVYDVLGRKVVELAEGYHAAGYYSATWDASGQASGVYFARLVVTSSSGEVEYSKVNKLVLMK